MRREQDLTLVHPWDPWRQRLGGFDTWLDGFVRAAPRRWAIELIGWSEDAVRRPVGRWHELELAGRPVRFLAACRASRRDRPPALPDSLRFVTACRARAVRPTGSIVQLLRFECERAVAVAPEQRRVQVLCNDLTPAIVPPRTTRWRHAPRLYRRMVTAAWRRADAVVAIAPGMPETIERAAPGRPVLSIDEWVEERVFHSGDAAGRQAARRRLRTDLGWPAEARVVVYGGRLEAHKGVDRLIEAAARLAAQQTELRLLIVGAGREAPRIERLIGETLGERGRRVGPRPRAALGELYRGCDLGVCASERDAGPRFVFEALACGLPVVSTRVGRAAAVIGEGVGSLVDGTPEALASAIGAWLDEKRSPPGLAARCAERVAPFRPGVVLAPLFELYDDWLG